MDYRAFNCRNDGIKCNDCDFKKGCVYRTW
jgi:hypothetical protein